MPTITKSIGTASRDYSTITAWEADLDNGAIYASGDDAVGECYADSALLGATINGGATIGLSSRTLSVASGERHDGTAGTGVVVTERITVSGTITTVLDWIEIDLGGTSNGCIDGGGIGPSTVLSIRNGICHDAYLSAGGGAFAISTGLSRPVRIQNTIVYDVVRNRSGGSGTLVVGVAGQIDIANAGFYNLTIYGIEDTSVSSTGDTRGLSIDDNANGTIQNCLVVDVSTAGSGSAVCFNVTPTLATCSHNLSSDATASGTGSLTNKTSANQFVSTVGGSEDLHLKAGADAIDAGTDLVTTPTGVNIDIDGRDRDAEGDTWDIGAHEYVSAGGVTANSHYYMASQAGAVA